jgi:hypothetical protein
LWTLLKDWLNRSITPFLDHILQHKFIVHVCMYVQFCFIFYRVCRRIVSHAASDQLRVFYVHSCKACSACKVRPWDWPLDSVCVVKKGELAWGQQSDFFWRSDLRSCIVIVNIDVALNFGEVHKLTFEIFLTTNVFISQANARTMHVKLNLHNIISIFSLKTLIPGRIQTRYFIPEEDAMSTTPRRLKNF